MSTPGPTEADATVTSSQFDYYDEGSLSAATYDILKNAARSYRSDAALYLARSAGITARSWSSAPGPVAWRGNWPMPAAKSSAWSCRERCLPRPRPSGNLSLARWRSVAASSTATAAKGEQQCINNALVARLVF